MSEIKRYITSRFPDGYVVEGDLKQIEVVAQAFLSGDIHMIQDILDGVDFHSKRCAFALKETYEAVLQAVAANDPFYVYERKKAKGFSFQRAFGAGAPAIAESLGIPLQDAQAFIKMEEEMYPGVKIMQDDWIKQVKQSAFVEKEEVDGIQRPKRFTDRGRIARTGKLRSITGREYTFFEEDSPDWLAKRTGNLTGFKPTRIKNYPIQGFAGEILRLILGKLYRKIKADPELRDKVLLINTVHDSILLDVCASVLDKACRLLKETMESAPALLKERFGFTMDVPVGCDIEYGRNWLDMNAWIQN